MKTWKQKAKRRLQQLEAAEQRASRLESQLTLANESSKVHLERAGRAEQELEQAVEERGLAEHQRDVAADALVSLTSDLATLGQEALIRLRDSYPLAAANPGTFLSMKEYAELLAHPEEEGALPAALRPAWAGEPFGGPDMAEGTISSALETVTVRMMRGFAHNAAQAIQHEPGDSLGAGIVTGLRGLLERAASVGEAERIPPEVIARLAPPSVPEPYRLLVNAVQEVDALLSADGPPFRLDGFNIGVDGEAALLSLHDRLNDVTRIFFPSWEQHP